MTEALIHTPFHQFQDDHSGWSTAAGEYGYYFTITGICGSGSLGDVRCADCIRIKNSEKRANMASVGAAGSTGRPSQCVCGSWNKNTGMRSLDSHRHE